MLSYIRCADLATVTKTPTKARQSTLDVTLRPTQIKTIEATQRYSTLLCPKEFQWREQLVIIGFEICSIRSK